MNITKKPNGAIAVSEIIDGHLQVCVYYFTSQREAVAQFRKDYLTK
jgi:hypothetical protein